MLIVLGGEVRDELVDRVVEFALVVDRPGNNERGTRFVDEDRVDLVDNRVIVRALDHLLEMEFHVIAQVVETQFVIGAVGHIAGILLAPFLVGQAVDDAAHGQAEELIDLAHPCCVAARQIVVDGHDMYALAFERVQVDGQGGDEGLAFAGFHFGDAAIVQHHAADQLDVEMALAKRALGGFPDGCESLHQEVFEVAAIGQFFAEAGGASLQVVVGECGKLGFQGIDFRDPTSIFGDVCGHWWCQKSSPRSTAVPA